MAVLSQFRNKLFRVPYAILLLFIIPILSSNEAYSQNLSPRPTNLSIELAATPRARPTHIRRLEIPIQKVFGAHLEVMTDKRIVYSKVQTYDNNSRLYYWEKGKERLTDTREDGVPGSVIAPDDGRYMIYLHDETDSLRDINGDGYLQNVLRLYHFESSQVVNLGIPARSATPRPGETRSSFEYAIQNNRVTFSASQQVYNNDFERDAPWQIIDLLDILYEIEGTPTPTPTFTPIGTPTYTPTPTQTPTPSDTPNRTPVPTIPPGLLERSDINADGKTDLLDLLLFQMNWGR